MRGTRVLIFLFCLLAWAESRAAACSCRRPTLARQTLPADGDTDFPPSGRIRIFLTGGWPRARAARRAEEYRLVEDDEAAIEEAVFATLDEGPFAFRLVTVSPSGLRSPGVSFTKATGELAAPTTFRRPGEWSLPIPKQAAALVQHWLTPAITAPSSEQTGVQDEPASPAVAK